MADPMLQVLFLSSQFLYSEDKLLPIRGIPNVAFYLRLIFFLQEGQLLLKLGTAND